MAVALPPTTVPFAKVIVKLVKLSTNDVGLVTLIFMFVSELTSIDKRYRSMSCWAVDAAVMSCVCSKMNRTATRANSKTRATVPLTEAAAVVEAEADADVTDAVLVVVVLAVVCMAPAASVAVLVGTLRIGGTYVAPGA